jgi:hypothetical protein
LDGIDDRETQKGRRARAGDITRVMKGKLPFALLQ